ncbi:MAG: class I SAM-dependent methyltransferase [Algibacter sp.]|uniref:class I SAM-dependent methyltransferase n=1 Tax=Algibacter sp. TaxID=1872428 RepID=UPI002615D944|nr:class I SAM-dependent methyltransferase [Algibacter sp.]MDG1731298.1 class I SAM-dependent methyltransferase [Algibacter sp.]MDG2177402.1 class I SAM-dependent methyltransferase [Algibacter sp.]
MINSPLFCNGGETKLVETFNTSEIIADYKNMNIDVQRFFKEDSILLYECVRTGYRFYYPFSTIGDAKFYDDLSKDRNNYYSHRWEHKIALNYINKSDSVLEIGSGFGVFLNLLKQKKIKAKGLELNPHAVKQCKSQGLDVKEALIQQEALQLKNAYSIICYFQVLEHITEVHDFIKSSLDTLKKDGKLIIGVPNNNPYLFINDKYHTLNLPPHHAGLWNKKSLKSLETIFPLKLEEITFEPLVKTYSYFLNFQINNSNVLVKIILKTLNKLIPRILKKVLCKFIKGRNVLVVFKKTI